MYRHKEFESLLRGRNILIAGYGREGKSTHNLLRHLVPNTPITIASNDQEIATALAKAKEAGTPFDLIIKSPGIPTMKFEGLCDLDTITSQTDLFLQIYGDQTIGITGTKGKSTTTSLIHHILTCSLGGDHHVILAGNIGIPLLDIVDQLDDQTIVVAELSCHQLENIHRAPHIGVILNLFQEHLDHYHDYHDYQMAKMQMMACQQVGDHCFYCSDNTELCQRVAELAPNTTTTLHPYSLAEARRAAVDRLTTSLQGDHNLCNIFVAKQACSLMGVSETQFAEALATFHGLQHRLELVGTYQGITFYNDSISTIPQATIAAVETLQHVDTLILGGFDRGIDYSALENYLLSPTLAGRQIHNIVFVGEAGRRLYINLSSRQPNPLSSMHAILVEDDYSKIVDWCFTHTQPDTICLLSPAAASYDSFKNFEERGNTFKELIRNHK